MTITIHRQDIYNLVSEELENEVYDIMDVVTNEQMQQCVWRIFYQTYGGARVADTKLADMNVRVHNSRYSFVSVSTEEGTGIANSMWYAIDREQEQEENVKNVISMINEAYYASL